MNELPTEPLQVPVAKDRPWQPDQTVWSFGTSRPTIVGGTSEVPPPRLMQGLATDARESSTAGPQEIRPPTVNPVVVNASVFGKRSLLAIYQWEGVVERVDKEGFQCRLVPLRNGTPDQSSVELTEFSFEDLATESDRSLLAPGAILYWTVGRARNAAGTVTNQSLVRLRRLPAPSESQKQMAEREADSLIRALRLE